MPKAVSEADKIPSQTLCEGHKSTERSGINKENQRRKRTGSFQFWLFSAMGSL